MNSIKNKILELVLRWQRNRMGGPLSPLQIHQKIMWMLSNFYKTASEHWLRTPGTQKGSPFSSKGGRTKYERQKGRQKSKGRRPILGRESCQRRSFQTPGNPLNGKPVGSFGILESNITGREKKKNPQNMRLTTTPSAELAQTLIRHQQAGAGQGGTGCIA